VILLLEKLRNFFLQLPRTTSLVIVIYSYFTTLYTGIVYLAGTAPWVSRAIQSPWGFLVFIMIIPMIYGSVLLVGVLKNKISWIKKGLAATWIFNLTLSTLNIAYFAGRGTAWTSTLFVGLTALMIYCYYVLVD